MIIMDKDFSTALEGFDKVWRRVQQAKPKEHHSANKRGHKPPPLPQKRQNNSRARRFEP